MSEPESEMTDLEQALRRLTPRSVLSREAVLFEAGRSSAPRSRLWPIAAGSAVAVSAILGVMLWRQPIPQTPAQRIVYVDRPQIVVVEKVVEKIVPAPQPASSAGGVDTAALADYLSLRDMVIRRGVEALPPIAPQPESQVMFTPIVVPRLSQDF